MGLYPPRFMGKRRDRRLAKRRPVHIKQERVRHVHVQEKGFAAFYNNKYKFFLIIPFILLLLAITQISFQVGTTGDFVAKGVGLRGGIVYTLFDLGSIDSVMVDNHLHEQFPDADITVKKIVNFGEQTGLTIEVSGFEDNDPNLVIDALRVIVPELTDNYSIEVTGAALGEAFFTQVIKAMLVAFSFMGVVVFFYFGKGWQIKLLVAFATFVNAFIIFGHFFSSIFWTIIALLILGGSLVVYLFKNMPSFAVFLAVLSDILVTLAVINLMGVQLTTAGIAAFLMIIGYSVDTNILLSTRVLKRTEGTVTERIMGASKTGLTMSCTTLAAVSIALIFSRSEVLIQIMTILFIGLIIDVFNTWLQNAGLLKWYLTRKEN